jgi:hypothetical protein
MCRQILAELLNISVRFEILTAVMMSTVVFWVVMLRECWYPPTSPHGVTTRKIILYIPNIKFHENPFGRSRNVACVQMDGQKNHFNRRSAGMRALLKGYFTYFEIENLKNFKTPESKFS